MRPIEIEEAFSDSPELGKVDPYPRKCTCHPDDNPPVPCPGKHAYSECVSAARISALEAALRDIESKASLAASMCDSKGPAEGFRIIGRLASAPFKEPQP